MESHARARQVSKNGNRIIIHFDYDCFYASVVEAHNPELKRVPLAIQQKQVLDSASTKAAKLTRSQIVVTCNYLAREKKVKKLQLVHEAKKICPDLVIVLGEDISLFRDASKELYTFLRAYSWNGKVERLGFDEVWLDVTDIIDYNLALINHSDLPNTFFCLSKDDPTFGFLCNASQVIGHVCNEQAESGNIVEPAAHDSLQRRLVLGSHLAHYLHRQLKEQKGYTSTVGISTSKMLSKLVGNSNKPNAQTTLFPTSPSNVTAFINNHEVGKIPGIGFKMAQKLRDHYIKRPAKAQEGLVTFNTKDNVTVKQLRTMEQMGPELLQKLLGGPGWPADIGHKTWALINGLDDSEVKQASDLPRQISIEDSYVRLDTHEEVIKELKILSRSLIKRMHIDLLEDENNDDELRNRRWLAHPKTIRLSTRPRGAQDPVTGMRPRSFQRVSRSAPLPNFIFNLNDNLDAIVDRLVDESLLPLFRKLHPEKSGWNLSLLNVAITNMVETAGDSKSASGRDIESMFKNQEDILREWKVPPEHSQLGAHDMSSNIDHDDWLSDEELDEDLTSTVCHLCGAQIPPFAMAAHQRFHENGD